MVRDYEQEVLDAAFGLCRKGEPPIALRRIARKARCSRETAAKYLDADKNFKRASLKDRKTLRRIRGYQRV